MAGADAARRRTSGIFKAFPGYAPGVRKTCNLLSEAIHCDPGVELMSERSRILVVDDETQITRVLKTLLQSQGYEVKTASDGETALNLAVDWIPDLIVTDLSMPRMSGIELCRLVRERSQAPNIVLAVREEEK